MKIDIVTAFPNMFSAVSAESIIKNAINKGLLHLAVHDLRDFTTDKHRQVDDTPYGGGPGMLLKFEPFYRAVNDIKGKNSKAKVVLLTPQGELLNQAKVKEFAKFEHIIMLCGHYEGIDERIRTVLVDIEISIGDYVLTGGELPAMVLLDAVTRRQAGVLGNKESLREESFEKGMLEYPQYTKPSEFMGHKVPEVLLSGDHAKIARWREDEASMRTAKRRPDLSMRAGKSKT